MRKIIRKARDLGQKASDWQAAAQRLPPKFDQLREAVTMTTAQLQQLRSDVQSSVAGLKAEDEGELLESLREINGSAALFRQAGYELGGVDLELSPVQRLIVHLNRLADVPLAMLRSLASGNEHRKVTRAILLSLIRAEEMADQVDLDNLAYYRLTVNVGPIPVVRLCWTTEDEPAPIQAQPAAAPPAAAPAVKPVATSSFSGYGTGSFFERTAATPQAASASAATSITEAAATPEHSESSEAAITPAESPTPAVAPAAPAPAPATGDWSRSALDRFKKMPDLSKPRRG